LRDDTERADRFARGSVGGDVGCGRAGDGAD